jgi:glycosyl transferase family 2
MSSVDVIVPCYRYAHFLRECVGSVLAESELNVRVLIIDDASPDNTAEVATDLVREDSRVAFRRHATNKGHIATYNEGIEWLAADYMLLLSADDYLLPGALSMAANLMNAHPEVGFTFGKVVISAESGIKSPPGPATAEDNEADQRIMNGLEFIELIETSGSVNIVPTPTAVVRTELLKRVGGYRPELPHTGDLEMWLRLAAHASVGAFDAYQAVWRRHGSNMQLEYYRTKKQLPDLRQRKAALDCFIQTCESILPDAGRIHRGLLRPLGHESVARASGAFNDGEIEVSARLSEFAVSVCPEVKWSLRWALLGAKRCLGFRVWNSVQPAFAWVRHKPRLR